MNSLLRALKNRIGNAILPQVLWLPRYYILLKWGVFKKSDRVLDVGCGEGDATLKLAEMCCQVVGLDIIEQRLKAADAKRRSLRLKDNITFVSGDVLSLPFAAGTFDQVVFLDALPEVEDDEAALREIARVLKPGGRLIITAVSHYACMATLFPFQKVIRRILPRWLWRPYRPGKKSWLEADDEFIKKEIHVLRTYTLDGLCRKAAPYFEASRSTYVLKKYGALTTDITYGIKGFWYIRPVIFWFAVRLDYFLQNKSEGYSIVLELTKK